MSAGRSSSMRPTDDAYVAALAPLFEGAPGFLARVAAARPFETREAFFAQARAIAHAMPERDQVEFVDAHPRLGAATRFRVRPLLRRSRATPTWVATRGRPVPTRSMSPPTSSGSTSTTKPASGSATVSSWPAGHARPCLPDMAAALGEDRDSELHRALDAVVDIAADRLMTLDRADGVTM